MALALSITPLNTGGAVRGYSNSTIILDNCKFVENSAEYQGGAVAAHVNTTINVTNTEFINNSANDYGGAISARHDSTIVVGGSSFVDNNATYGGAIRADYNSTIIADESNFVNNTAVRGGAVYGNLSSDIRIANSNFTDNGATEYGGAVYGLTDSTIDVRNSTFNNNTAGLDGGAIRGYENSTIGVSGSTFNNNTASEFGGAIAGYANTTVLVNTSEFNNNTAVRGGAIRVDQYSVVNVTGSNFTSNAASSLGGAISIYDDSVLNIADSVLTGNTACDGGAIYGNDNTTILIKNCDLLNNVADGSHEHNATIGVHGDGGAVFVEYNSNVTIEDSRLNNNSATNGGAVYGYANSTIKVSSTGFANNSASEFGGAISGFVNTIVVVDDSDFDNNTAVRGGAIRVDQYSVVNVTGSNFISNAASSLGGAISIYDDSVLNIVGSVLTGNTACDGGAIYGNDNSTIYIGDCDLSNNTADGSHEHNATIGVHGDGGAVFVEYNSNVTIEDSRLNNNSATNGGAVYGYANSTIKVSSTGFANNSASEFGGAISGFVNTIVVVDDSDFDNNTAVRGGAIRVDQYSVVNVTGSNFTSNAASSLGGAISIYDDSVLNIVGSVLTGNTACDGGAIYGNDNSTIYIGDCDLSNNTADGSHEHNSTMPVHGSGGAVFVEYDSNVTIEDSRLNNNSATNGGAIYGYANSTIKVSSTGFANNSASEFGGAISGFVNTIVVVDDSDFDNNTAVRGGAIRVDQYSVVNVTGSNFTGNSVSSLGGAISIYDDSVLNIVGSVLTGNTACDGGAIYGNDNSTIYIGDCDLSNNTADGSHEHNSTMPVHGSGGAVFVEYDSNVTIEDSRLNNNSATNGGAVYGFVNSTIIVSNSSFANNSAIDYGGAIYGLTNSMISVNDSNFANNSAEYGGAIRGYSNSTINLENSNFTGNNAGYQGGAVAAYSNTTINVVNTNFINNSADQYGGAITAKINSTLIIDDCKFINNTLDISDGIAEGGAIGVNDSSIIKINNSLFENNSAISGGSLRGGKNSTIEVNNSKFIGNTADYGGAIYGIDDSDIEIIESEFNNNEGKEGGAINAIGDLNIKNSSFANNSASDMGSAIYNIGQMNLENSNFNEVDATGFATVYLGKDGNDTVTLKNNTIETNLVPIYNNQSMIVSPTTLVVLDNGTYYKNVDDSMELWAHLYDDNNNTIGSSSPIVLDISGMQNDIPLDFEGTGDMDFVNSTVLDNVGVLPVTGTYAYANNTNVLNALLVVSKIATNVTVTIANTTYGEPITGNVTLTDVNGTPINGTVNVTVNGIVIPVEVTNGVGTFEVPKLIPNNYTADVVFGETYKYLPSSNSTIFNVGKFDTDVTVEVPDHNVGDVVNGKITLTDENGDTVNGTVNVTVNGVVIPVEVINGIGTFEVPKLASGTYGVSVTYGGDEIYNPSNNVSSFEVNKIRTNVTVTVANTTYGETITGSVSLTDVNGTPINGTVNVTVNGTVISVLVTDGHGTFEVADKLIPNNYTADIVFGETDKYLSSSNSTTFKVDKLSTIVAIDIPECKYGDMVNGEVTLTDINNNPISGNVTVTINGRNYTVEVIEGKGTFEVPKDLIPNNYTADVAFNENDRYLSSDSSTGFNVARLNTTVAVTVPDHKVGETVDGEVVLTDENGNGVNGTVNVTVDGVVVPVVVVDGKGTFEVSGLSAGDYDVAVAYGGDVIYNPSVGMASFIVAKIKTDVTVAVVNTTYGETISGSVTLTDEDGNGVNGTVTVTVGDKTVDVTVTSGLGAFEVPKLVPGDYVADVSFAETEKYLSSSNSTGFNVARLNTTVAVTVPDHKVGETVDGEVVLTDENGNGVNGTVNVTVDGVVVPVVVVDGKGTFEVSGLSAGDYDVAVAYGGDAIYNPSVGMASFNVAKIKTDVTVAVVNTTYGETIIGSVTLTDEDGNPLSDNVTVTINGNNYSVEVSDGHGTFEVPQLIPGNYVADVSFAETEKYLSSSNSTAFNVARLNTTVTVNVPDYKIGETTYGDVTLTDENGNAVNGNVNVVINGNGYSVEVVDGKGTFEVSNQLDVGNYEAVVTFDGDSIYNPSSNASSFEVSKTKTNVTVTVANATYGEPITGNVTLIDEYGNPISGNVVVTVDGTDYSVEVVDGKGTFEVSKLLDADNYTAEVVFGETDNYYSSSNLTAFEVAKLNTTTVITVSNVTYGEYPIVEVEVKGPGYTNISTNVTVSISGKNYTVEIINGKGSFILPDKLGAGVYNAETNYTGDKNHNPSANNTVFNVAKAFPQIDLSVEHVDNATIINIKMPEDVTGNVTVTIDGKNYIVNIVNGTGTLEVSRLTPGDHTIIVSFGGNQNYANNWVSLTVNIPNKNNTDNNASSHLPTDMNNVGQMNVECGNLKTGNPIMLLLLILLALPIRRLLKK